MVGVCDNGAPVRFVDPEGPLAQSLKDARDIRLNDGRYWFNAVLQYRDAEDRVQFIRVRPGDVERADGEPSSWKREPARELRRAVRQLIACGLWDLDLIQRMDAAIDAEGILKTAAECKAEQERRRLADIAKAERGSGT